MHRIFEESFTSKDVIQHLCLIHGLNVKEAVSMGKKLERHKLIHHVSLRASFSDEEESLFRFYTQEHHQNLFWMQNIDLEDCSILPPSTYRLAAYLPNLVIRNLSSQRGCVKYPYFETIEAAVLFADISGYTALTELLVSQGVSGTERLTQYLNEYFSRIIGIISNFGGDVVKFAGDALVVIWPTLGTAGLRYSAHIASQCAMSLIQDLGDFNAGGSPLSLHVGISCGPINCMLIGTSKRAELVITGRPLQEATNCEGLARPGEVVISCIAQDFIGSECVRVKPRAPQPGATKLEELLDVLPPSNVDLPLSASFCDDMTSFVPEAVSHQIVTNGSEKFISQLRLVSVLFIQIPIDASLNPSIFCEILQGNFLSISSIVETYEGAIRQLIVDDKGTVCIVAFGLPPKSHEDDPHRAVLAALRIQEALLKQLGKQPSIGVTTGHALCGPVGSRDRHEYSLVGSAVNMAARLMGKSSGRILCDKRTYLASNRRFVFKVLPPVLVKGRAVPLDVYLPVSEHRDASLAPERRLLYAAERKMKRLSKVPGKSAFSSRDNFLVGRTSERRKIDYIVSKLSEAKKKTAKIAGDLSSCILLSIEGESGSGKSLLVNELLEHLEGESLRSFRTFAYSSDTSVPFGGMRGVMSRVLNNFLSEHNLSLRSDQDPAVIQSTLQALVPENLSGMLHLLRDVLPDLSFSQEDGTSVTEYEDTRVEAVLQLCTHFLSESAIDAFVWEDVQWLDSMSWLAIQRLFGTLSGRRMIVLSFRTPEKFNEHFKIQDEDRVAGRVFQLTLSRLDKGQICQLVANITGLPLEGVDPQVSHLVFDFSGGNPMFAVEFCLEKMKARAIVVANGRCHLQFESVGGISAAASDQKSFDSVLLAKFDAAPTTDQLVLKVAASCGRHFSKDKVGTVVKDLSKEISDADINASFERLGDAGFLQKRDGTSQSFMFRSPSQRDAIYKVLLGEQKKAIHCKIAAWVEEYVELPDDAILAFHYKGAEKWDLALTFLTKLGLNAFNQGAYREAIWNFRECLEVAGKLTDAEKALLKNDIASLHRYLGDSLFRIQSALDAEHHLEESLRMLSFPTPSSNSAPTWELLLQIEEQMAEIIKSKKKNTKGKPSKFLFVGREASSDEKMNLQRDGALIGVHAYVTLSIINYYRSTVVQAGFCAFKALILSAQLGLGPQHLAVVGTGSLALSAFGKHDLANQYPLSKFSNGSVISH
jgi:class 3 adenylate cyclase